MKLVGDEELLDTASASGLPSSQLLLAAILTLQMEDRRASREQAGLPPPEVLLADLGMSIGHIARVTGRNYETVKSTIRRGRELVAKEAAARKTKKANE